MSFRAVPGLVVDSSVLLGYLFPDDQLTDQEQARLESSGLIAPNLVDHEITNSIAMSARRGRLRPGRETELIDAFLGLEIERVAPGPLMDMYRLSERHDLTAYDAAYLELALRRGVPLLTRDSRLAAAARAEGAAA